MEQQKRNDLKRTASNDIQEQQRPDKQRLIDIPPIALPEARSTHLGCEAHQDEPEYDVENEHDNENNNEDVYLSEPYQSPVVPQELQCAQSLAERATLDEFFNPLHENMLRLPFNFKHGSVLEGSLMVGEDNVTARFHNYKQQALKAASSGKSGAQIDTQLYEIAALSHILIVKPGQYGKTLTATFGAATLDKLYSQMLEKALDHSMEFLGEMLLQIRKMVTALKRPLPKKKKTIPVGGDVAPVFTRMSAIVFHLKSHYGFSIFLSTRSNYIDFTQANYDKTIGHGEAKVAEPTRNNDAFCRDLLCLATFGKDTVDRVQHRWQSDFRYTFYLVELKHEALYTMTELRNIQVPDPLNSFSHLSSTDTLSTLVRLNDLVVNIYKNKLNATPIPEKKKRKTLTTPEHNKLLDKVKNCHRHVPLLF